MASATNSTTRSSMPILAILIVATMWLGVLPSPAYQQNTCPSDAHRRLAQNGKFSGRKTNWACRMTKHVERRVHSSQHGQDGVLEHIFHHIGVTNKYYVEFGFDATSYEGGGGANTGMLHKHYGWQGLLMDGANSNPAINLHTEMINADNILSLFEKYEVPLEPDYVSVDIDSADLWVIKEIVASKYRPRVISGEYNSNLPLNSTLTWPRGRNGTWDHRSKFYGASLGAYHAMAEVAGYSIIWVVPHDVFFVRNDLLEGRTDVQPLEHWKSCSELPIHGATAYEDAPFAEYHTYMRTGDEAAAAKAGQVQMREMNADLQSVP